MHLIETAKRIAKEAHAGQYRKYHKDVPYTAHTDRVGDKIYSIGYGENACAAAHLHDVFEDGDKKYRTIVADTFGQEVYVVVHELTNPSKGLKSSRELRKMIDREHMKYISPIAAAIKLADRADNLQDLLEAGDRVERDFRLLYCEESHLLFEVLKQYHDIDGCGSIKMLRDSYVSALEALRKSNPA